MNVRDLIEILNKFPQDAEVCVPMRKSKSDKIEYFILNPKDINEIIEKQNYEDFDDKEICGYGKVITVNI